MEINKRLRKKNISGPSSVRQKEIRVRNQGVQDKVWDNHSRI